MFWSCSTLWVSTLSFVHNSDNNTTVFRVVIPSTPSLCMRARKAQEWDAEYDQQGCDLGVIQGNQQTLGLKMQVCSINNYFTCRTVLASSFLKWNLCLDPQSSFCSPDHWFTTHSLSWSCLHFWVRFYCLFENNTMLMSCADVVSCSVSSFWAYSVKLNPLNSCSYVPGSKAASDITSKSCPKMSLVFMYKWWVKSYEQMFGWKTVTEPDCSGTESSAVTLQRRAWTGCVCASTDRRGMKPSNEKHSSFGKGWGDFS